MLIVFLLRNLYVVYLVFSYKYLVYLETLYFLLDKEAGRYLRIASWEIKSRPTGRLKPAARNFRVGVHTPLRVVKQRHRVSSTLLLIPYTYI